MKQILKSVLKETEERVDVTENIWRGTKEGGKKSGKMVWSAGGRKQVAGVQTRHWSG